mgnify:CR=1 FL=1
MNEIKKILSALSKEELLSLCASLLFSTLVNLTDLSKLLNEAKKV